MVYEDSIFGSVVIDNPVVIKIIENPEFQRLKKIICQGVPEKYYCFRGFPRYEHSIGVYLILNKLNADYKEQIAGLLHDISHKAFSHVYDWIIKDYTKNGDSEDAQDKLHSKFIEKSSIKQLLTEANLDPQEIFDLDKYKLLDYEIPYLCADRIEYSIRSLTPEFGRKVLDNLVVKNGRIVCKDKEVAREYAYKFLSLQNNEWGSPEAAIRYYHFSEILKLALKLNVLNLNDFDLDDSMLVDKILDSKHELLVSKLYTMASRKEIYMNDNVKTKVVYKKFRHIDPEIIHENGNKVSQLSEVDNEFKNALEDSRIKNNVGTEFTPLW